MAGQRRRGPTRRLDPRRTRGRVALRYRIRELPRIASVSLEGGPILYAAMWRVRLANIKDVPQDPTTLTQLAEELRAELVRNAYLDATVEPRIVAAGEDRVDVVLKVTEGPQVKLAALTLGGNKKLSTAELTALFRRSRRSTARPRRSI